MSRKVAVMGMDDQDSPFVILVPEDQAVVTKTRDEIEDKGWRNLGVAYVMTRAELRSAS